jgi:hypothetical protein
VCALRTNSVFVDTRSYDSYDDLRPTRIATHRVLHQRHSSLGFKSSLKRIIDPRKTIPSHCLPDLWNTMVLTQEQSQTRYACFFPRLVDFACVEIIADRLLQYRFLAILLPTLTLCTHTLLALSFLLPGTEQYRAIWSLVFNVVAASASILGLIGAVRVSQPFVRIRASPADRGIVIIEQG